MQVRGGQSPHDNVVESQHQLLCLWPWEGHSHRELLQRFPLTEEEVDDGIPVPAEMADGVGAPTLVVAGGWWIQPWSLSIGRSVFPVGPSKVLMVWDVGIVIGNVISFLFSISIKSISIVRSRAASKNLNSALRPCQ